MRGLKRAGSVRLVGLKGIAAVGFRNNDVGISFNQSFRAHDKSIPIRMHLAVGVIAKRVGEEDQIQDLNLETASLENVHDQAGIATRPCPSLADACNQDYDLLAGFDMLANSKQQAGALGAEEIVQQIRNSNQVTGD